MTRGGGRMMFVLAEFMELIGDFFSGFEGPDKNSSLKSVKNSLDPRVKLSENFILFPTKDSFNFLLKSFLQKKVIN